MLFSKTSLAACGLATFASGHMIMNTPQPFAVPAVHNGPLQADGSDFPCQITGSVSAGGVSNTFALGSTQPLKFTGQATHGGGSCQVSLTYDTSPTKNSVWKVIHSIQGGCPAKNTPGNMGDDASAPDPFTYSFPVPSNIPTGQATLAWSWLNKIGNREFYMNCAPVTLTGTSGDKANYDALPDMLIANIAPGNGCGTTETFDYKYPSPGDSVEDFNSTDLIFPTGNCGPTATGGSAAAPAASTPSASTPAAASPTESADNTSASPAVFVTVPTGGASSAADPPASTPAASTPAATTDTPSDSPTPAATSSSPSSSPSSSSGSSGSGSAQTAGSACSPEGEWVCLGTSYQQCGSGVWTPVMPLAAGTSCTPGEGSTINIVASGSKARRFAQRFRG